MINNSFNIHFLRELSKGELSGLLRFVQSPYFNSNRDVVKLYEYIHQFAPNFNHKNFTKKNAYQAVYPGKNFNASTLNGLLNRLFIIIRKFIHYIETASNTVEVELSVLKFCTKKLQGRFENQLNKTRRAAQDLRGSEFYRYNLAIEHERADFLALTHNEERNLETLSKVMDQYYWISKLSLICEILNHQILTKHKYNLIELENCLEFTEKNGYIQYPLVHLWYSAAIIFRDILHKKTIHPESYHQLKNLLLQNKNKLDNNEKRNLCTYLTRILVHTSFEEQIYYQELFEVYKIVFDEITTTSSINFIQPRTAINIVNVALRNKNVSWAEDFLAKYKTQFKGEQYDVLYCEANINFYKKDYDSALKQLKKIKHKDIFFKLGKRVKFIQIYYETEEQELLDKEIGNFKSYISRQKKKHGEEVIKPYQKFGYFVYHIIQLAPFDKEKLKKLKSEIEQIPAKQLPEKQWLLQKIEERLKRR